MKTSSRTIAYVAILFALVTVLVYFGFVQVIPGVISIAVLPLLLVMLTPQVFGLKIGLAVTTYFGLCSLANAFLRPSVMAPFLQNPVVSVLPRIVIAFTVYFSYALFTKVFSSNKHKFAREFLPSALSAGVGVITNTSLVLGLMSLIYGSVEVAAKGSIMTVNSFILTIILVNFLIEFSVCIVFVPPLNYGLKRAVGRTFRGVKD